MVDVKLMRILVSAASASIDPQIGLVGGPDRGENKKRMSEAKIALDLASCVDHFCSMQFNAMILQTSGVCNLCCETTTWER